VLVGKLMPLARIITRTPQDAVAASEYLRSLGYRVETVSPGEFRITPADIELNLDRCGAAEAVQRALAVVESGASAEPEPAEPEPAPLEKAKVPVAYDITGQPVEFAGEEETEGRSKPGLAAWLERAGQSVRRPWNDFLQQRAERRTLKLQAAAEKKQETRRREAFARQRLQQEITRQREAAELAHRRQREQIEAEQAAAEEQARIAPLPEVTTTAEREMSLQPTLAPPPGVAPVVAAEAAPENQAALPAPAEAPPEEAALPPVQLQAPRALPRPRLVKVQRTRAPIAISRTAVASACGLGLLVIMGFVAYANRRPASPLPAGALTNVKQDVPFGPATITPSLPASKPSPAGKRSAAVRTASRKPSAGQGIHHSSRDDVQDDVVVRHLQPAQSKPQPSTAKLKRHSDLD
jgi:hypothetical protein